MIKKFLNMFGDENEKNENNEENVDNSKGQSGEFDDDDDDDDDEEDSDEEDDEWPEEERGQKVAVELDPVTLHGLNYTEAEFDAEVEKRVKAHLKEDEEEGEDIEQGDIDNYYLNIRKEVYQEWTGANMNMTEQWLEANSMKYRGHAAYGSTQHDENNPLLQSIHGVSLQDYSAMTYFIATGADFNAILAQLGIDSAVWQEANVLWSKRMTEDTTFTVTTLFSQYYNTADQHPKLSSVAIELSEKGKASIERMRTDREYFIDAQAAVSAAYEYGIDGAQWLIDHYEITNGDLQKIAAYHAELDNKHIDGELSNKYSKLFHKKMDEYKKKFAEEQGGNVADDISF